MRHCIEIQKLLEVCLLVSVGIQCIDFGCQPFPSCMLRQKWWWLNKRGSFCSCSHLIYFKEGFFFLFCRYMSSNHSSLPLVSEIIAEGCVRVLIFTLMVSHCGMVLLIRSPALWIKNTLWLTLCTLWLFESWQGEKNTSVLLRSRLSLMLGAKLEEGTTELLSTSSLTQCLWLSICLSFVIYILFDFSTTHSCCPTPTDKHRQSENRFD